ncbi:hypothetical protein BBP40_010178 [Aspergillus hancockii]|nr:hypothetical protein BBP40_010178 [Aspergillus hancockii]
MEATQESTQPCTDPRRMGYNNSGLLEQDVSDIICILHPSSPAAHHAVAASAGLAPQHILQKDELAYESSAALDIALRLTSNVVDLNVGFCFGRNKSRCDLLLAGDMNAKRISNQHFRIYLTEDGIIMLEDTSTNGTIVDNCRLRKSQKENSRMLTNGSVIQVMNGDQTSDEVRFVVRIPNREGFSTQYTEKLLHYFQRIQKHQIGTAQHKPRQTSAQPVLQWTVSNTYGMHWTGGPIYNVTGQIGKGAFATVYKLATKQHGIVYAAKELDKRRFMKNGVLDQKVDNEMKIMRDLKHPNIVQYMDHHEHDRWIYIIMEYVPGGELSTYLQSIGKIPEHMVRTISRQVLHALQYLHKRRITHRDIKPDNILISSLDPLRVKLSDFGLSKVVQEESFLKTFCGTLLYCAPEVYPEPPKTSPYSQAVDMWSLGAVLYHILSGVPPYMGRGDDRGAQMLRMIMTSDPDYDILRAENVSESGIDFVARLLNRDPQARPTERECFQHRWIADVEDVDEYEDDEVGPNVPGDLSDIGEDVEDELDASQLSIHEGPETEDPAEQEDGGLAQSKRPRIDPPSTGVRYPSLPEIESFKEIQAVAETAPKRLFGEITASVLGSSDVLGANIDASEGDNFSINDFISSAGESIISDGNSLNSILSLPENPIPGSAPSLMGAEKLVGQLNMNSWHPGTSINHPPVVELPVRHTGVKEATALKKGMERNQQTSPGNETPKPAIFSRRIELPMPDTASDRSSPETAAQRPKDNCNKPKSIPGEIFDIELAETIDAKTGQPILDYPERAGGDAPADPAPTGIPKVVLQPSRPRTLLGKLTTLPGSIFELTIPLEDRMTSWGRGPLATVCYPDPMDTRIPAYALEVTFWAPAIESKIRAGQDWMSVPGVIAILSTKTRKCIWVNDTELRRGPEGDNSREGFHFGKLYTGDIITIHQHRHKFLKFRCEFYHGDSACTRPENEKGFTVRKILAPKDAAANQLPAGKDRNEKR